jgi:hypothetical protein
MPPPCPAGPTELLAIVLLRTLMVAPASLKIPPPSAAKNEVAAPTELPETVLFRKFAEPAL